MTKVRDTRSEALLDILFAVMKRVQKIMYPYKLDKLRKGSDVLYYQIESIDQGITYVKYYTWFLSYFTTVEEDKFISYTLSYNVRDRSGDILEEENYILPKNITLVDLMILLIDKM
jgi:hypothetical protein